MPIGIRVTDLPAAAGTLDDDDEFLSLEDGSLRRATRAQAGPKAAIVQVLDTANQFTATNVEGVLAEIQDNVDALVISGGGIAVASEAEALAGTNNTKAITPARLRAAVRPILAPAPSGSDDTATLQALVDTAQTEFRELHLQAGTYLVDGTLATSQAFEQPVIVGHQRGTTLSVTAAGAGLKFKGGSGETSGGRVVGIEFQGIAGTVGLLLEDCTNVIGDQLRFGAIPVGVHFHNNDAGSFTEFNVIHNSNFLDTCVIHAQYTKEAAAHESFHGSGFRDCIMVHDTSATGARIRIGAGALVYNAPLDGTFFHLNGSHPFLSSASARPTTTFGSIRVETSTGTKQMCALSGGSSPWHHVGTVTQFDNALSLDPAQFRLATRAAVTSGGFTIADPLPWKFSINCATGANALTAQIDAATFALVTVNYNGPNYDQAYIYGVYRDQTGSLSTVTTVATLSTFDAAGYGAPTISISGGTLTATNAGWPASGVTAFGQVVPMLSRGANNVPLLP